MAKFDRMMGPNDCDFIQVVNDIGQRDGGNNMILCFKINFSDTSEWLDWFIGVEQVKNRTGDWYFGVVALKNPPASASKDGSCADLTKDNFNYDFNQTSEFPGYELRIYTGGCYYFNASTEEWEGAGISVRLNYSKVNLSDLT